MKAPLEAERKGKETMKTDRRHITMIARRPGMCDRSWDDSAGGGNRLIFVDSLSFLPFALDRGIKELGYDIDRVIIDHTGNAVEFLELMSSLPYEFLGDLLFVRGDGAGFLSAIARGGDRILYSLAPQDIDFYLLTHNLLRTPAEQSLPQIARMATA